MKGSGLGFYIGAAFVISSGSILLFLPALYRDFDQADANRWGPVFTFLRYLTTDPASRQAELINRTSGAFFLIIGVGLLAIAVSRSFGHCLVNEFC